MGGGCDRVLPHGRPVLALPARKSPGARQTPRVSRNSSMAGSVDVAVRLTIHRERQYLIAFLLGLSAHAELVGTMRLRKCASAREPVPLVHGAAPTRAAPRVLTGPPHGR